MDILVKVIEPTRREEGNIAYILHRSMDNPDELMFDEIWVDKESLETHLKQPYIISAVDDNYFSQTSRTTKIFRNKRIM